MRLKIRAIANSKENEVIEGNPIIIRVREKPEKNKANITIIKILSRYFKKRVRMVSGLNSKNKVIDV